MTWDMYRVLTLCITWCCASLAFVGDDEGGVEAY